MILLSTSVILLFLIFELISRLYRRAWDWRASLMMASLAWGCVVTILTELLSLSERLDPLNLAISWGTVVLLLSGLLLWLVRKAEPAFPDLMQLRKDVNQWMREQDLVTWVMFSLLGIQAILLLVVSLMYAPNTYESMTYHLPRAMHWLQNASLENIASTNVRDVYFPPFSEFVFLHGFALAGSDHYLNLFQWGAFLLCLIGVSAVAAELGAQRNTQVAAALLAAGVPMVVLQATTARNDLVVSAWLVSLIWFGLRWSREPDAWLWVTGTGVSLGLAVLTKATSFIYALPLCILIGVLVIRKSGLRSGIVRGCFVLLLTLLLNLGHFSRNVEFYMNPAAIHQRVGNDAMSPAVFASNTIRNVAIHVPTDCKPPLTLLNGPGRWLLAGLGWLHTGTGLSPTDAGTTWGYVNIFDRSLGCIYDEHYAGNPMHMLLVLGICLALPFLRSVDPLTKWYSLALVSGFMLLNLTLRWQVWGSHLQIPLFVLWAPILAVTLSHVRQLDLSRMTAVLAVGLSFIWIYNNQMRPLSGLTSGSMPTRNEQYFQSAQGDYPDFNAMADLITGNSCDRVGLNISSLALEYPLWVLLREKGFDGVIEHVDVPNETRVFEDPSFVPCAVISEGVNSAYAASMSEHAFGDFEVYLSGSNGTSTSP
jgi:4-amino-4-deoxy-L-arabinose transferase-like glycosyltransferase